MPKEIYMHFEFNYQGARTSAQVNFEKKDVTLIQTPPGGGKADVIIIPLDQLIKMADEANEQRARNG